MAGPNPFKTYWITGANGMAPLSNYNPDAEPDLPTPVQSKPMSINQDRLDQYLKIGFNVLLEGAHGIGKTAIVKEAFERNNLRWKYFSASTMDPWVDLVGIPTAVDDPEGGKVLELVPPAFIKLDQIDALFFDELNRAPEKVLNAVMEIIQFKSINGRKLNNLKVVWAAINPSGGEYATTELDPAHRDRFHIQLKVPYSIDSKYFAEKFPLISDSLIDWWSGLSSKAQQSVSPRRLEYVAQAWEAGIPIADLLPPGINSTELATKLKAQDWNKRLAKLDNHQAVCVFVSDINNANELLQRVIAGDKKSVAFFEEHKNTAGFSKEQLAAVDHSRRKTMTGKVSCQDIDDILIDDSFPVVGFSRQVSSDAKRMTASYDKYMASKKPSKGVTPPSSVDQRYDINTQTYVSQSAQDDEKWQAMQNIVYDGFSPSKFEQSLMKLCTSDASAVSFISKVNEIEGLLKTDQLADFIKYRMDGSSSTAKDQAGGAWIWQEVIIHKVSSVVNGITQGTANVLSTDGGKTVSEFWSLAKAISIAGFMPPTAKKRANDMLIHMGVTAQFYL